MRIANLDNNVRLGFNQTMPQVLCMCRTLQKQSTNSVIPSTWTCKHRRFFCSEPRNWTNLYENGHHVWPQLCVYPVMLFSRSAVDRHSKSRQRIKKLCTEGNRAGTEPESPIPWPQSAWRPWTPTGAAGRGSAHPSWYTATTPQTRQIFRNQPGGGINELSSPMRKFLVCLTILVKHTWISLFCSARQSHMIFWTEKEE